MQKTLLPFVVAFFFSLILSTQGQPDSWIGIDCGANTSTATFGLIWETDQDYTKSGTNHFVPDPTITPLAIFQTLRAFTDQNKNCYTLPTTSSNGYFIRAAFLYANYDGRSKPPTFDLEIDGNKWTTVVTSATDYSYYEILYWTQKRNMSVCLARTQSDQFPFISSLEAWPIDYDMYTGLNQDLGWMSSYRYDYGPNNGVLGSWGGDEYNRIWQPISVAGGFNTSGGSTYSCNENPPRAAMEDAIEALDNTTSLFLLFSPLKTATTIYIEAYFTVMQEEYSDTRSFDMYVGGNYIATITTADYYCMTQRVFVQVSSSTLTIELRPTAESTLPPIISAIEVYTATDPLITNGTDRNDLNGLMNFTNTYDRLKGWSGEPCLPADTQWQWLSCATTTLPPRVTSLYLSGYQLSGSLTDFSQMQALVDIDLSKNNLSGEIPAFLGKLPNLRKLNLSYNDFSGVLPFSIRNNKNIAYDVSGNPNLDKGGSSTSKGIIIGLAVGIPLLVILVLLLLVFWLRAKQQRQNQETNPETGNGGFPEQHIQLQQPTAPPTEKDDEQDYLEVNANDTKPSNESMAPDMELDELEVLVDEYTNGGDHAHLPSNDDDYVAVGDHSPDAQSMVPDLDEEMLQEIIRQGKERADDELGSSK